ncbi:hypothetical protein EKO27_g5571 [Xylaria grammica]|uniref:RING-type domain-containing protein n=1 Tax=Xylaria grammica TaxID=363999 RepID=A0A439D551_9PEZI|nr:hypothetical protein EKO27_g5571 [Xylaria grammica]
MEVKCQAIRPNDARQYRQRSVSVLPRSDSTQYSTSRRYTEYPKASAAPQPPTQLVLSPKTYERLAAVKREQDGLRDNVIAEALVMREHQHEELERIRQFRESAVREQREREEVLRQQQMEDFDRMMLEFKTRRAIEEEERIAEQARREAMIESIRESMIRMRDEAVRQRRLEQDRILAEQVEEFETRRAIEEEEERIAEEVRREAMIRMRDEAARQRQLEQDRILAEQVEEEARIEEARIQAQAEAEERERIRRERLRECVVCMEEDDMSSMIQTPCAHWYCHEDLQNAADNFAISVVAFGEPVEHIDKGL